jgi:hypothetical protein
MKSRTRLRLTLAGMLVAVALLASGCAGGGKDELVIGVYGSMTGNDATSASRPRTAWSSPGRSWSRSSRA